MAQRVEVRITCDQDHGDEVAEGQPFPFSYAGVSYTIDLCNSHAEDLAGHLHHVQGYAERAQRTTPAPAKAPGKRAASKAASKPAAAPAGVPRQGSEAQGDEGRAARAWALAHDVPVPSRGRLPAAVLEQYRAAQGGQPAPGQGELVSA